MKGEKNSIRGPTSTLEVPVRSFSTSGQGRDEPYCRADLPNRRGDYNRREDYINMCNNNTRTINNCSYCCYCCCVAVVVHVVVVLLLFLMLFILLFMLLFMFLCFLAVSVDFFVDVFCCCCVAVVVLHHLNSILNFYIQSYQIKKSDMRGSRKKN